MNRPLAIAVLGILDAAVKGPKEENPYEWSVQGMGMLRLYIRKVGRIHIWDTALRYPGVSMIHNHSWDLQSTVVSGELQNVRYVSDVSNGELYWRQRIQCGYDTHVVRPAEEIFLRECAAEHYGPGDVYNQKANVLHRTDAMDGTVTLMERDLDQHGQADVVWPFGSMWGNGKPRLARWSEVQSTIARAMLGLEQVIQG